MEHGELCRNIECLVKGWIESCGKDELLELHQHLGGKKKEYVKHKCPGCGEHIFPEECPEEAPDFLCYACHIQRYYDDPDWREDTDKRRENADKRRDA